MRLNAPSPLAKTFVEWLTSTLNDPTKKKPDGKPATCVQITVVHVRGGAEIDIYNEPIATMTPEGVSDLAQKIRAVCQTDAQNLSGSQQYIIYAFYDDMTNMPGARYVLRESGHVLQPMGELATEPATPQGLLASSMRNQEGLSQMYMQHMGAMLSQASNMVHMYGSQLTATMEENRNMFEFVKNTAMAVVMNQQAHEIKLLEHQRTTQVITKAMQFAPAMLNTLFDKPVVPQSTTDTMILEGIVSKLDAESMEALSPIFAKLDPAEMGLVMSRIEQIMKKKHDEEAQLKAEMKHMNASSLALSELGRDPPKP